MKKTIIVVLLLLATTFSFAQKELSKDYDYQVSSPYRVVDAYNKIYFSNGNNVLAVKVNANKNQVLLQKYDLDVMKEIGKEIYNDLPKNFIYEGVVEIQNKYYFFYSSWTGKKTQNERLFYREIDFSSGTFKNEAKQIINFDGHLVNFYDKASAGIPAPFGGFSNSMSSNIEFNSPKFDIIKSKDNSKVLVQYRNKPTVKKDTKSWDIINVSVFDNQLNKIWRKQYTMPYTERRMNFINNMIDNNGNVFITSKVYHDDSNKDKKHRKDKEANYHIELFEINSSLDKIKTTKIRLDDKFINGINMFQLPNKEIILSGYYNKGKELENADGLFIYKINQKGEFINKKYYEIPLEILNQYVKNKTKKKNNKKGKAEAGFLILQDVLYSKDNSLILIGEVQYKKWHKTKSSHSFYGGYYTFHYEDILITKIKSDGKLEWMKKIPKRQAGGASKSGMSYTYYNYNGNHYIIYLDNVKNINLPLNKIPAGHSDGSGGYLTSVKINNKTGEIKKESILDLRKIKKGIVAYQFKTDRIVKIKDNEFFVEFYKKKKEDVFLKIEIKN